ncbi:hypothetical protein C3L33_02531, partial [Rhododendron williamsianum]
MGWWCYGFHPKKLFVFGDSYADTGNLPKSFPDWQVPYGITFPGKPDGHFSDGRVLTSFLVHPSLSQNMYSYVFCALLQFSDGNGADITISVPDPPCTQTAVKFESPILKPCCFGTSIGYRCGSLNAKGEKMYTLCKNPKATFFWDTVHPTQAGWRAVFIYLKSKFEKA